MYTTARRCGEAKTVRRRKGVVAVACASLLLEVLVLATMVDPARAQLPTPFPEQVPPSLPGRPRPLPPPPLILPPLPPSTPSETDPFSRLRVRVREIRVLGSTIFTPEELARITTPYIREVSAEDLEDLRVKLTRLYVEKGYINSGAILPDQTVTDGIITYQIIEGRLSEIEFKGLRWFRPFYLRSRLGLAAGPPLNVESLQERIQLLLEDARLRRLSAELKPGLALGEAVLSVDVDERPPYHLWLEGNNYQSPAIGAERGIIGLSHQNLLGLGDTLTVSYGRSEGVDLQLDAVYAIPVTPRDTTLLFEYRVNNFRVVEEPFTDLDIRSDSDLYGVAVRQPVYRTLRQQVAVELAGERLSSTSFLLGRRFSFSPGVRDGEQTVTALRFAQDWLYRTESQVIAARSRFSFGLDALGATINTEPGLPDGRFFAWLGQFQFVRRFGSLRDTEAIFRADVQLSADPLLPLEQVSVGGRYTVRGYRENTFVRDNALVASVEARVPLLRNARWAERLELAPFFDFGRSWNTNAGAAETPANIYSVGIGLRWAMAIPARIPVHPRLEVYWGYPLRDVDTATGDSDPQDHGVHFQFVLDVF